MRYGVTEENWRDATEGPAALRDLGEPGVRRPGRGGARRGSRRVALERAGRCPAGSSRRSTGSPTSTAASPTRGGTWSRCRIRASPPTPPATAEGCPTVGCCHPPTAVRLVTAATTSTRWPGWNSSARYVNSGSTSPRSGGSSTARSRWLKWPGRTSKRSTRRYAPCDYASRCCGRWRNAGRAQRRCSSCTSLSGYRTRNGTGSSTTSSTTRSATSTPTPSSWPCSAR